MFWNDAESESNTGANENTMAQTEDCLPCPLYQLGEGHVLLRRRPSTVFIYSRIYFKKITYPVGQ